MSQPFGLWGLPRLSDVPPERRTLVLARYGQLNKRDSWKTYAATIPLVVIIGLVGVAALVWAPSLLRALGYLPSFTWISVLFGLPGAIISITPVLVVTSLMRKNYRLALSENGFCRSCSYDLRATPDRCPECGARPTAKGAAA